MDRAFRAIRRADVVGMVIDAVDGVTQQDFRYFLLHLPPDSVAKHIRMCQLGTCLFYPQPQMSFHCALLLVLRI